MNFLLSVLGFWFLARSASAFLSRNIDKNLIFFPPPPRSTTSLSQRKVNRYPTCFRATRLNSEYSVVDEEEEDDDDDDDDFDYADEVPLLESKDLELELGQLRGEPVDNTGLRISNDAPVVDGAVSQKQYGALTPGTVVDIQVGDISLGRKAWKKRRRSGSPLLVPCSVLKVDRKSLLQWNIIYLLQKFGKGSGDGIRMTLSEIAHRHRTHLKSSLATHATALGYSSIQELVESIFSRNIQETTGIQVTEKENSDGSKSVFFETSLSKYKAQKRAAKASLLQFLPENADEKSSDILHHTGRVRNRRDTPAPGENLYRLQMLSAALRVSQEDVDSGRISNGSFHSAFVFDYDLAGDGGSPLLTLSLNSPSRSQFDRIKMNLDSKHVRINEPSHHLSKLSIGDYLEGKVVSRIAGGVLLDCGVGRTTSTGEIFQVLATLKFTDAAMRLRLGDDDIPVFVKAVSKQSGRLIVTMDHSVQGKTAKEMKKASEVEKKLSRLGEQLGGLDRVEDLVGIEMNGIVQAMSQTGDWVYIQPITSDGNDQIPERLPVGIASVPLDMNLDKGDDVRIQLQGIDMDRGQLAIKILSKR